MLRLVRFPASLLPPFGGLKSDRFGDTGNDSANGLDDLSDTDCWLLSASESCSKPPSSLRPRKRSWLCPDFSNRTGLRFQQSGKSSGLGYHVGGGHKNVAAPDSNDRGGIYRTPEKLSGIGAAQP